MRGLSWGGGVFFDEAGVTGDDTGMSEGIGAGAAPDVEPAADGSGAIAAEWQKIERERLAEERAEAREDLDPAAPVGRRLPWRALVAALLAGVVAAVLANRHLAPVDDAESVEVVGEAARLGIMSQPLPLEDEPVAETAPEPVEAEPEVFVPVPAAAVGPPKAEPDP